MPRSPKSVLIVDPSADNREVLRTALSLRGLRVWEAEAQAQGYELACQHHPDVIVVDAELEPTSTHSIHDRFADQAGNPSSPIIILGCLRRDAPVAGCHVIDKPYHFAPLIHTIERLAAKAA